MALPDLSNSMYVAHLRHIQSIHEPPERRNPDTMVRRFIPLLMRLRASWLGKEELSKLRAEPFYYYLIARTKYYDQMVQEAVADGVQRIVGIGCGSDTRAHRFKDLLCSMGVKVLECDQEKAISAKQRLARRWGHSDHVAYLPIDLNDGAWPDLERWLGDRTKPKTLVMLEGVSPYIDENSFGKFLLLLSDRLATGSHVAYDFKIRGFQNDLGRDGRTKQPFRLSTKHDEVTAYHQARGLHLDHLVLSSELCELLLPDLDYPASSPFIEDCLVRLQVVRP